MTEVDERIAQRAARAMTAEVLLMWLQRHGFPALMLTNDGEWRAALHGSPGSPPILSAYVEAHRRPHGALWSLAQKVQERIDAAE